MAVYTEQGQRLKPLTYFSRDKKESNSRKDYSQFTKDQFIEAYKHIALAKWVLSKLIHTTHREYEDTLWDIGFYTLLSCVKNFKPELEIQFSTYATVSLRRNYGHHLKGFNSQINDSISISPRSTETIPEFEQQELCIHLLKSLTDDQQIVVQLYYYQGKTINEIQELLGLPSYQIVQQRLKAGLSRMKQCYS